MLVCYCVRVFVCVMDIEDDGEQDFTKTCVCVLVCDCVRVFVCVVCVCIYALVRELERYVEC